MRHDEAFERWAQATYTSFDDDISAGGWQIKQTTGHPSEEEITFLRSRVETTLAPVDELPRFPLPEEIAALPRRLVYLFDGTRAGYWHSVPAGPDATGRPGNVFTQMLLDRQIQAADPPVRPIAMWRSPDLLCPFGPDEVRAATMTQPERPRDGAVVTAETVVRFVCDPDEWRAGVLCALVDAVAAALVGGPLVVLGVDSADEAACWIGALTHLMAPRTSRAISFSTFERADTVGAALGRLHLVAVPRADLAGLDVTLTDLVVVLDSAESIVLGAHETTPHRTQAGSSITVTQGSTLAEVAVQDDESARLVLHELDAIVAAVPAGGYGLWWPLAAAMARHLDTFSDVAKDVLAVLTNDAPADLDQLPDLAAIVDDGYREAIGTSAAHAWNAMNSGGRRMRALAASRYATIALTDRAWLSQDGGPPAPDRDLLSPAALDAAQETLPQAVAALRADAGSVDANSDELAHAALGLTALAVQLELDANGTGAATDVLHDVVRDVVLPVLVDANRGPEFALRVGPLDRQVADLYVLPALAASLAPAVSPAAPAEQTSLYRLEPAREAPGPFLPKPFRPEDMRRPHESRYARRGDQAAIDQGVPASSAATARVGQRIPQRVLSWAFGRPPSGIRIGQTPYLLELEYLVSTAWATPPKQGDRPRVAASLFVLAMDEQGVTLRDLPDDLQEELLPPPAVELLLRHHGRRVPEQLVLQTLSRSPWDDELAALIRALPLAALDRGAERAATSIVQIRKAAHALDTTVRYEDAKRLLRLLDEAGTLEHLQDLGPVLREELSHRVVAAAIISVLSPRAPRWAHSTVPSHGYTRREPPPASQEPLAYGAAAQHWWEPPTQTASPSYWDRHGRDSDSLDTSPRPIRAAAFTSGPDLDRPNQRRAFWGNVAELALESSLEAVQALLRRAVRDGSIDVESTVEAALFADPSFNYGDIIQCTADERHIARIEVSTVRTPVLDILAAEIDAISPMTVKDVEDMTQKLLNEAASRGDTVPRNVNEECLRWAKERWRKLTGVEHRRGTFRRSN